MHTQSCAKSVHRAVGDAGVCAFVNHHVQKAAVEPTDGLFVALLACRLAAVPSTLFCLIASLVSVAALQFCGVLEVCLTASYATHAGLMPLLMMCLEARLSVIWRRWFWMCRHALLAD